MGWNFRKSVKIGPGRLTFSKSGISASVGVKGARITKSTSGRTTKTIGIPGTGLYHTSSHTVPRGTNQAPAERSSELVTPRHNFTDYSPAERRELAAMATPEDRRAAWMGRRDELTLVQAAYRWRVNQRTLKVLGIPLAVILAVILLAVVF